MRIETITNAFVRGGWRRGCYMKAQNTGEGTHILAYKSSTIIAEIYDYKDDQNYRLRLHPYKGDWGKTAHNNRIHNVLMSIQYPHGGWDNMRYQAFYRYGQKVYDRKLNIEYTLDKPLEFTFKNGRLLLDYRLLETHAYPEEPTTDPTPTIDSNANTIKNELTTLIGALV